MRGRTSTADLIDIRRLLPLTGSAHDERFRAGCRSTTNMGGASSPPPARAASPELNPTSLTRPRAHPHGGTPRRHWPRTAARARSGSAAVRSSAAAQTRGRSTRRAAGAACAVALASHTHPPQRMGYEMRQGTAQARLPRLRWVRRPSADLGAGLACWRHGALRWPATLRHAREASTGWCKKKGSSSNLV